jgi:chromosome segregation ATPase
MPRERVDVDRDASEAAQKLGWLEQERQRDKAAIEQLRREQQQYEGQLAHLEEGLDGLEQRLTQIGTDKVSSARLDKALQQFKDEMLLEWRRSEQRVSEGNEARDKRIVQERQERVSGVTRLEQRVTEAFKIQEAIQAQRAEIQRLTKTVSALQLQIDEVPKEVKAQNEKLLSFGERVKKSEASVAEISKAREEEASRSESLSESIRLVQARMDRVAQQMPELESSAEQQRLAQAQLGEELRKVDDRGKKQISGWTREMASWRKEVEALPEQIARSDEQYREGERMISAMDAMRIQLEKDRESLQHIERTAEERQRQQLEDWRKENELLWLRNDERWAQLADENAKRDEYIAVLWETPLTYLRREVAELGKLIKGLEKRLARPNR